MFVTSVKLKLLRVETNLLSSWCFCFTEYYDAFIKVRSQKLWLNISGTQHICWVRNKTACFTPLWGTGSLWCFGAQFSKTLAFTGDAWQLMLFFFTTWIWAVWDVSFYLTAHLSVLLLGIILSEYTHKTRTPSTCPLRWKHPWTFAHSQSGLQ